MSSRTSPHGVVVDTETAGDAGAEVLDDQVGARAQFVKQFAAALGLQVDGNRPLAAVGHRERIALAVDLRPHPPGIVAGARLLDLDDVGAQLGQHHRAVGAGQETCQIEDSKAAEWSHESFPHCGNALRYAGSLRTVIDGHVKQSSGVDHSANLAAMAILGERKRSKSR